MCVDDFVVYCIMYGFIIMDKGIGMLLVVYWFLVSVIGIVLIMYWCFLDWLEVGIVCFISD